MPIRRPTKGHVSPRASNWIANPESPGDPKSQPLLFLMTLGEIIGQTVTGSKE
jgi:hypothetical protein